MDKHEELIKHIKGVRRVVINAKYGGYGLSHKAIMRYLEMCGTPVWPEENQFSSLCGPTYWLIAPDGGRVSDDTPSNWHEMTMAERTAYNQTWDSQIFRIDDVPRDDPYLVKVVEELGSKAASSGHAELKIVDIPADVDWEINEYDGKEWIAEKHRTWS